MVLIASVALGLSLGEYTALYFAGAFSFEDGVRLTKARGEAMQYASELNDTGMIAISGLDVATLNSLCKEASNLTSSTVEIANYLAEKTLSISGSKTACSYVKAKAIDLGALATELAVAGAFHTSYMKPAESKLIEAINSIEFKNTRIPIISNYDASPHFNYNEFKELLVKQLTNPVKWESSLTKIVKSSEFIRAYEIGPGTICRGLAKKISRRIDVVGIPA